MSDDFDRRATQIIDTVRKSAGCGAEGELHLYVAASLRLVHYQGLQDGFDKCRTQILAEFAEAEARDAAA